MSKVINMIGGGGGASALLTVTAPTGSTVTAKKGNKVLTAKEEMVTVTKPRLPEEYQEVEYIQSTGTQYCVTDYYPNRNTIVKMSLRIDSITYQNTWAQIFGVEGSSPPDFAIWGQDGGKFNFYYGSESGQTAAFTVGQTYLIEYGNGAVIIDGVTTATFSSGSFTLDTPLAIGAINNYLTKYPIASQTLYPVEIIEGTDIVRHYIPCYIKETGEAGLYDLVSGTFFGNSGSGAFVVGADADTYVTAEFLGWQFKLKEYGTWVVTVTNSEYSGTLDLLVDEATNYYLEEKYFEQLVNHTMLYYHGDECEDVTGGWVGQHTSTSTTHYAFFETANTFDWDNGGYSLLFALAEIGGDHPYAHGLGSWCSDYVSIGDYKSARWDITAITGSGKVAVGDARTIASASPTITKDNGCLYTQIAYYKAYYVVALCKPDDLTALCDIVSVSAPSTSASLAGDATKLAAIFGSKDAVLWMAKKCTGDFMIYAVANSTFLSALEASEYSDILYKNEHWAKFLNMAK